MRLIEWVKRNRLSSLLLGIILVYLLWNFFVTSKRNYSVDRISYTPSEYSFDASRSVTSGGYGSNTGMAQKALPVGMLDTSNQNRMVQKESSLSLLVKDVREASDLVIKQAEGFGGFMIQSSFSNPGESPSGSITVRVPSASLKEYLEILREQSLRVVSEQLSGTDITDQYKDINARLETLNSTKRKFEDIYDKATIIQDILEVQNRIIELQDQIDSLKGQQQYMEKSTEMARVTIYLSTDDLSLPYAPDNSWRPSVVFKNAVRSLVENLRGVASALIWIAVYVVFWGPILIIVLLIRRNRLKKRLLR